MLEIKLFSDENTAPFWVYVGLEDGVLWVVVKLESVPELYHDDIALPELKVLLLLPSMLYPLCHKTRFAILAIEKLADEELADEELAVIVTYPCPVFAPAVLVWLVPLL